jgi:hypothetical protein
MSHIDFLLPYFCRILVHIPDKALAHHLPNGRMPCKWHGWDNNCCTNARVFSQHGPRTVFHENGSIEYKFYSTYYCSIRENESKEARKNARESDSTGEEEKEVFTQHTNKPEFWTTVLQHIGKKFMSTF